MVVAEINTVTGGSTGKIMLDIAQVARENGIEIYTFSSKIYRKDIKVQYKNIDNHFYFGNEVSSFFHKAIGRCLGINGFLSFFSTLKLVKQLKDLRVDTIHLHNIHDFCINLPVLFYYIKKHNIKVIWTLHDCWSFTGHCPYYTAAACNKWQNGCGHCPQKHVNPRIVLDTTKLMWRIKRRLFSDIRRLTIVTPSKWLAGEVQKSFLKDYPVIVINNGIDLSVFHYRGATGKQAFCENNKFMILGVASGWDSRKGIDVFIEMSNILDPQIYQIVLVGTNESIDRMLPNTIKSIHRTNNQDELAQIYSCADVFVNPTKEDNYPTVNMEAIACGTPVITYNTGGSSEMINNKTGSVIECNVDVLIREIERVRTLKPFIMTDCIQEAKSFDKWNAFNRYIELYQQD